MRLKRTRDGTFTLSLPDGERKLLVGLADNLRDLLMAEDAPGLERLFPPAFADDPEREKEYRALVHDELLEKRLASLEVLESTAQSTRLDEGQLTAWMTSINDIRLVLGTMLDASEDMGDIDPQDPQVETRLIYEHLGALLGQIVHTLARW